MKKTLSSGADHSIRHVPCACAHFDSPHEIPIETPYIPIRHNKKPKTHEKIGKIDCRAFIRLSTVFSSLLLFCAFFMIPLRVWCSLFLCPSTFGTGDPQSWSMHERNLLRFIISTQQRREKPLDSGVWWYSPFFLSRIFRLTILSTVEVCVVYLILSLGYKLQATLCIIRFHLGSKVGKHTHVRMFWQNSTLHWNAKKNSSKRQPMTA